MTRYLCTSTTGNELELRYNADGLLIFMELRGTFTDAQWLYVTSRISMRAEDGHMNDLKAVPGLTVTEAPLTFTFDDFWQAYQEKRNKLRAEKLWARLSDADRIAAIAAIPKYDKWLSWKGIAKKDPDTYLRNRSWEDEYKMKG
jgi:hypothetical protein